MKTGADTGCAGTPMCVVTAGGITQRPYASGPQGSPRDHQDSEGRTTDRAGLQLKGSKIKGTKR